MHYGDGRDCFGANDTARIGEHRQQRVNNVWRIENPGDGNRIDRCTSAGEEGRAEKTIRNPSSHSDGHVQHR